MNDQPSAYSDDEIARAVHAGLSGGTRSLSGDMQPEGTSRGADVVTREETASLLEGGQETAYSVDGPLAEGGMGMILRANDLNIRRPVAIKLLHQGKDAPRERILRFIEEAQVTSQLEHPNIVPVHELGIDGGGNVFYSMKLVRGRTLQDILDSLRGGDKATVRDWPLNELLSVFVKICDAIAFAHSRNVVHRDLKPENVMVGDFGQVVVMDWGLAKILSMGEDRETRKVVAEDHVSAGIAAVDAQKAADTVESVRSTVGGDALMTLDGQIMGTPAYMAPEQAKGQINEIGPCTDVYSLGAVLYSILTLRPPVDGTNVDQLLLKVVRGEIVPPTAYNQTATTRTDAAAGTKVDGKRERANRLRRQSLRKQTGGAAPSLPHCPDGRVPVPLSAVAMKAMALEPRDRYRSVTVLEAEVQAYLNGFATSVESAGWWRVVWLLVKRHKMRFLVGTVCVTILAAVTLGFIGWINGEKTRAENNERRIREALTMFEQEQELQAELGMLSAPGYLDKAEQLAAAVQWPEAARTVDEYLMLKPESAEGWWIKGQLSLVLLRFKTASRAFTAVRELAPDDLGQQVEPYESLLTEFGTDDGPGLAAGSGTAPGAAILKAWRQGVYDRMAELPDKGPVHYNYRNFYRFLVSSCADKWIPLLRNEKELDAWTSGSEGRNNSSWNHGVLSLAAPVTIIMPVKVRDCVLQAETQLQGDEKTYGHFWVRGTRHDGVPFRYQGGYHRDRGAIGMPTGAGTWSTLTAREFGEDITGFVRTELSAVGEQIQLTVGPYRLACRHDAHTEGAIAIGAWPSGGMLVRNVHLKVLSGNRVDREETASAAGE